MSKRILVVDDSKDVCTIVKNALTMRGLEVITVTDGFAAMTSAMKYRPDLILLDVMMPKMSGFQVCENLRKRIEFAETPILFLTAKDTPQDEMWGRRVGGSLYLTKPFEVRELVKLVEQILAGKREQHHRPDFNPVKPDVDFED